MQEKFAELKNSIKERINNHDKYETLDAITYNTLTIFAISLASIATFVSDEKPQTIKALSGLSALLIAIERSLSLGGRWIYHKRLKHEYLVIEAMISNYMNYPRALSAEEEVKLYEEIHNKFYQLLRQETEIPGVSNSSPGGKREGE